MELILKYFDAFTPTQIRQLEMLYPLYVEWNEKINVISRKDMDSFYEKHVLHSLAIATNFEFVAGTQILDIGCGGGFPGIPLAIFFPEVQFTLVDSIAKKLKVVEDVSEKIGLTNIQTHWGRVESIDKRLYYDFAVSRAVAPLKYLWKWAMPLVKKTGINEQANGLICLKGGDLQQEISVSETKPLLFELKEIFEEDFFETKYMVYVKR
jgi:16S rRNA (guanine527-N7)-methyltransferase